MIFFDILRILKIKYIVSLLILLLSAELVFGDDTPRQVDGEVERESNLVAFDSLLRDSVAAKPRRAKPLIDDVMRGTNLDSLYYNVKEKKIFIYTEGDVQYQDKSLKADMMEIDMSNNEIFAYGIEMPDSTGKIVMTQPMFTDGDASYTMDTITYNMKSERAKIKGVATQEGDGWLVGSHVKKMEDDVINIKGGKYTTCSDISHPHFYLAMTKAKVIPGEKVVTGPAYFVMEDVPIYFLGIPEGFFPINSGPRSGLLMPSYGEDGTKGFFLRDLGYYFTINDYMDLTILGGIYSLGSWELSASSDYLKKYKYSGGFDIDYSNIKIGTKGESDYLKQSNFKIQWTHSQDAKANPGSTFSASVNLTTSGYSKYSATTLDDMLSTQTNSSISYSKSWSNVSLSTNLAVSQNSQDQTISVTFPSAVVSVSRFYPFKWGNSYGKDKWYEKISMTYTGKLTNSVSTSESEIFDKDVFKEMVSGVEHSIPVSASFSLFDYLNITPSFSYTEKWYAKSQKREWNPATNEVEYLDPDYGFNRLYNYSTSVSATTTLYGMFQAKNKNNPLQAVRHTITPTVGFSYTPDFSQQKYGYYETYQTDSLGSTSTYSPYSVNSYGVPSSGKNMSMTFSLSQNLEAKVLSKRDTSGIKKITIIDDLKISGSYNFLADSMKLSTIPVSLRTTLFGNYALNLSVTLDPYRVTPEGTRYDKLFFPGRVTSTGWSFSYSFKSRSSESRSRGTAINDITTQSPEYLNPFYDPSGTMDPVLRRQLMADSYYDFSLPWNVGLSYVISYGISYVNNGTTGYSQNVTQSLSLNGSVNLTSKTGVTFTSGYDLMEREFTTTSVAMTRDLHCWQMSFSWIPFGYYRSWSFNIGIKSSALADIKYDKSQSMYDNMY
ncbi:MAG: putative LPS assembly protein LptD [Rikenellaceae bacterium]